MSAVSMKSLLEAGIHFGHQTRRWNPKMKRYIFGARNGIYIIDLQKTLRQLNRARAFVREAVAAGGQVLFVGTKRQAQEIIQREAERCGMYYVNNRWLGGTLTNYETIQVSIRNLRKLEEMEANGDLEKFSKKEAARMRKQKARLAKYLDGIKNMPGVPKVMFVIDSKREAIAVSEARRLNIPCIGIVDTNCDPDTVSFPIPGNDDAIRAVTLFCSVIADAVIEGRAQSGKFMPGEMAGAAAAATTKPVEAEAEAAAGADDAADAEDEDDEDFEDEEE
ncbi:MAG TPA: 30S ribosomal protein S2 [Candidatus Hydrogenedentes bacterium]|nr:30S ribosomal protein S2 [Candidatus Hydrogenedentota bacterium]MDY0030544.1 30S ribosomal protein S2 [FCB group bacterium]NLT60951.1 30S ribosomal protein S2 [Candidatus Hydrogenedentota bacterium]HNV20175.1 30S ribosomal protein S2 [Candidatus Hydrogenedentota bacterium]HNZ16796.1 30S ribosomal protein S2 [Candidatus Hydrogenedentota bacterium]